MSQHSFSLCQPPLYTPFVIVGIVTLDVVDGRDTIEAPDDEDHIVQDGDAEVAAVDVHAGSSNPLHRTGLPSLHWIETGEAVETPDSIDTIPVKKRNWDFIELTK